MGIHFNDKEFKDLLKTFAKLSAQCSNVHAPISFDFDPFRMVMITDHAFISASPQSSIITPICPYTFNPEILLNLTFTEGDVELWWENATSALFHMIMWCINRTLLSACCSINWCGFSFVFYCL